MLHTLFFLTFGLSFMQSKKIDISVLISGVTRPRELPRYQPHHQAPTVTKAVC